MKRVYFAKIGDQPVVEVTASGAVTIETVAGFLREAADSLSGDTKICGECGQTTYKHQGFECQDCGGVNVPLLRLTRA